MDLRQVEYVLAVVDHGGFTRAARAVHVAQPSLSQAIRRLEAELGAPLFLRAGRRVELTEAGRDFLGPARSLIRGAEAARHAIDRHRDLEVGSLDVVALPTLVATPLAGILGKLRAAHPAIAVRVAVPARPSELLSAVLDGRAEIGVTEASRQRRGLTSVDLGEQELVAVFPPGTALPARVGLGELSRHRLVLGPVGTNTRDIVEAACASAGFEISVAVQTSQSDALVPLVLAGAGASVLSTQAAVDAERGGALVRHLSPRLSRRLRVVHRSDDLSPAARAFVTLARDQSTG